MSVTLDPSATDALRKEVARRRTFAIISHPDAGKTTLTEKLLLYGGAIQLAGAVRGAQGAARTSSSDWMDDGARARHLDHLDRAPVRARRAAHVTLLDTPGHEDFSEDTYRTLLAVDSVVMVIDAAKGIETQTRKLFEVCRNARPADPHLRQQARPAGPRSARAARRDRARARHRSVADELADRRRRPLPRRLRPAAQRRCCSTSAPRSASAGAGRRRRLDDPALARADRRATPRRELREVVELLDGPPARRSTRAPTCAASRRRCSSAAR